MPNFNRFVARLRDSTNRLDSPDAQAEQRRQDLNPANFQMLDREMARGNNPMRRAALMEERKRLEGVHMQQLQQAAQQFVPRLQQELDPFAKTGIPREPPVEVQLMMRQLINGRQVPNMNPGGGPYNPLLGGVRG